MLFLVIFASVFGGSGHTTQVAGGRISTSVYHVPGIIALGVIVACFGNLAASVTAQRERGVLKRRRSWLAAAAGGTVMPRGLLVSGDSLAIDEIAALLSRITQAEATGLDGGTGHAGSKA